MLTKFWEGVGDQLAQRWFASALPGVAVLLCGAAAMARSEHGHADLMRLGQRFEGSPTLAQALLIGAGALVLAVATAVVERATTPTLRLLEGYGWPLPSSAREWVQSRSERRAGRVEQRYQEIASRLADGSATAAERTELAATERQLRRMPALGELMPTRIGNTLRAAERRPQQKYGLDSVTVWPHLWLLLPDAVRTELSASRRSVDQAVAAAVWALYLLPFAYYQLWAAGVSALVWWIVVRFWVPAAVETFADLYEAAFDLYRGRLYEQLRWPLPTDLRKEAATGTVMSRFLWRGPSGQEPPMTKGTAPGTSPGN